MLQFLLLLLLTPFLFGCTTGLIENKESINQIVNGPLIADEAKPLVVHVHEKADGGDGPSQCQFRVELDTNCMTVEYICDNVVYYRDVRCGGKGLMTPWLDLPYPQP